MGTRKASDPWNLARSWERCLRPTQGTLQAQGSMCKNPAVSVRRSRKAKRARNRETWRRVVGRWDAAAADDQTSVGLAGCGWILSFSQNSYAENESSGC